MKRLFVGVVALLGIGLLVGGNEAGDAKPKYNIKQVMAKAMKGGAYKKLEKDEQIELFTALAANKPPVGEAADWKSKCEALIAAAKSGDPKALDAAANCAACHKAHKK
jgi:hypothetical protein